VLFAMSDLGLQPNRPYVKCAKVVGETMGSYHPHGDSAIYDTLVRLAQDFAQQHLADQKLPAADKQAYTVLIGMRSWLFGPFRALLRHPG